MRVLVMAVVLASSSVAVAQTWDGGDPHRSYAGLHIDASRSPIVEATVDGLDLPILEDVTLKTKGHSTKALALHGKPDQYYWRATFDVSELGVFDGEKHWLWVETGPSDFTNGVTLRFSPAGVEIPLDFDLHDVQPTPSWQVALLALGHLGMLVIAYRVALREAPPKSRAG